MNGIDVPSGDAGSGCTAVLMLKSFSVIMIGPC